MDRRTLLKIMGGIAALPALGKAIKGAGVKTTKAAKVAGKVLPKVQGMPEWFSPLVNKIMKEGIDVSPAVKRVEDIEIVKKLEIPSATGEPDVITLTQNKVTGKISIESNSGGVGDSPFELSYTPPKSDINLETGKEIKYPGDFSVIEQRPRPLAEPGDFEIDYESLNVNDAFSDVERLEKIATGKIKDAKKIAERAKGREMINQSPYEDIINRYPDPIEPDIDYANGGIASFANGGRAGYAFGGLLKKMLDDPKLKDVISQLPPETAQAMAVSSGGGGLGGLIKNMVGSVFKVVNPIATGVSTSTPIPIGLVDYKGTPWENSVKQNITQPVEVVPPADNRLTRPLGMAGFGGSEIVDILKRLGYTFADGGSVQTGLTKTVPPVKGPDSQGVETLFKRRYN